MFRLAECPSPEDIVSERIWLFLRLGVFSDLAASAIGLPQRLECIYSAFWLSLSDSASPFQLLEQCCPHALHSNRLSRNDFTALVICSVKCLFEKKC